MISNLSFVCLFVCSMKATKNKIQGTKCALLCVFCREKKEQILYLHAIHTMSVYGTEAHYDGFSIYGTVLYFYGSSSTIDISLLRYYWYKTGTRPPTRHRSTAKLNVIKRAFP